MGKLQEISMQFSTSDTYIMYCRTQMTYEIYMKYNDFYKDVEYVQPGA